MKDIGQYGLLPDNGWEVLFWLPSPRPSFDIWVKPEDMASFFFVQHHPYALSLLSRISEGFKVDRFHALGLEGSSKDWEILTKGIFFAIAPIDRGAAGSDGEREEDAIAACFT